MIPELNGKLHGFAVRAPVPTGSVVDLTFVAGRDTTIEEINEAVKAASGNGILRYTEDPIVSSDIVKDPHSLDLRLAADGRARRATWSRSSPGTTTSGATRTACVELAQKVLVRAHA